MIEIKLGETFLIEGKQFVGIQLDGEVIVVDHKQLAFISQQMLAKTVRLSERGYFDVESDKAAKPKKR